MSEALTQQALLDKTCEQLVDRLDTVVDIHGRTATVSDIGGLSLAMRNVAVIYRSPEEQQEYFLSAHRESLERGGNPSAEICTYTADNMMAAYRFDRTTGLVTINDFDFPEDEIRPLSNKEVNALKYSFATIGMLFGVLDRGLTDSGITRLNQDLTKAIESR